MFVAIKDNFCNEKVIVKRIRRGFFVCLTVERQVQFNLLNWKLPDPRVARLWKILDYRHP